MLETFITIICFFLMLSVLVIIHELGHFLTARFFKVKVEEFGLGYPPTVRTLFSWKGIPFTLNWIPIGGFVRMEGETGSSEGKSEGEYTAFNTKSKGARLIIILAGAFVNFVFGVLAFTFIYSRLGIPVPVEPPQTQVLQVQEGPGKEAGLRSGDVILRAVDASDNQLKVGEYGEFMNWVRSRPDADIRLVVKREEEEKELKLHTRKADEIENLGALSVILTEPLEAKFYPWYRMPFEATKFGLMRSFELTRLILDSLGQMGKDLVGEGKVPTEVAGPIGIVYEVNRQKVFSGGFLRTLDFTALFSINLAIMNILPIPALDGGRALFILLEFILGKKRVSKIEERAHSVGIIMLLILILLISAKDVFMIFR